jgi:hypothetical protein
MAMPAGLRSHTPINHTASTLRPAMESHSFPGVFANVTNLSYLSRNSCSQTQALIS